MIKVLYDQGLSLLGKIAMDTQLTAHTLHWLWHCWHHHVSTHWREKKLTFLLFTVKFYVSPSEKFCDCVCFQLKIWSIFNVKFLSQENSLFDTELTESVLHFQSPRFIGFQRIDVTKFLFFFYILDGKKDLLPPGWTGTIMYPPPAQRPKKTSWLI